MGMETAKEFICSSIVLKGSGGTRISLSDNLKEGGNARVKVGDIQRFYLNLRLGKYFTPVSFKVNEILENEELLNKITNIKVLGGIVIYSVPNKGDNK